MAKIKTVARKVLKAKQITTFQHPEGGEGLLMVAMDGTVYLKSDKGWIPFEMYEAEHDDTTV